MLAAHIDAILADFTARNIPFSHFDVADCIPNLERRRFDEVRELVFERMVRVPGYRLSIVHLVGEGTTVMCFPREATVEASLPNETPAITGGRFVI